MRAVSFFAPLSQMERNSKGLAVTVAIMAAVGISLRAMLAVLNRKDQ